MDTVESAVGPEPGPTNPLESQVLEVGSRLLSAARERKSHFWAREHWEEVLLRRLMENSRFRVQALRFVDVLPALRDDEELVRHLREYFGDADLPLPGLARWSIEHSAGGPAAGIVAGAVRVALNGMAGRFIGGHDRRSALNAVEALRRDGMAFTLDLLGEATVSERESAGYLSRYLRLLEELAPAVEKWQPAPLLDRVNGRCSPRLNLSVKVSSLYSQMTPVDPAGSVEALKPNVRLVFRTARRLGAFICLDMEQYNTREITLRLLRELLSEPEFLDWPDAGVAMQAYLRETETDLMELIAWVRRRGTPVTVRLVRGAYWDYETVVARQEGWPSPVWTEKWETDACYERCLELLLENHPHVETAIATHNVRSLALGLAMAERFKLGADQYEVQMLYGMADPLKDAIAGMGRRVRVYVPFGELIPGMSYLVRRLLENTASQSFLRMGFAEDLPPEVLLAPPAPSGEQAEAVPNRKSDGARSLAEGLPAAPASRRPDLPPMRNEPVRRFTAEPERIRFAAAIAEVRGQLGRDYPLLIHGQEIWTDEWISSINPAKPAELIGRVASANEKDAEAAVASASTAFLAWRDTDARERAEYLLRAAEILRGRRDIASAWEVLEAGKPWREADADVTEAIDFLEYYAREAVRLGRPIPLDVPGETNDLIYSGRGPGAVIAPWNFPLAIPLGMTAAAIAAGNSVVLKPAPQTPVVAWLIAQVFREAGLPDGVLNFLPGPGAGAGERLVTHPLTHFIAFTGSRAVGCRINLQAAEIVPGQTHLKRVIAELGGKNAIIIDSDADLDDAVLGTVVSAFGFSGQKCSAASRAIVVGSAAEPFLERLIEASRSIRIGMPEDPGIFTGPVIDGAARDRICDAIDRGREVARLVLETDVSGLGDGYFVGPTIFAGVPPDSHLAQEEIFGPVLAVMTAATFEEALAVAMDSDYALTGGVYSRSPARLEQAREQFRVGNLYLNRKITGAIVGRQPFGGFKMSGVGSKAGGPDYLLQFLEPRTITENTLRRGFAPEDALLNAGHAGL